MFICVKMPTWLAIQNPYGDYNNHNNEDPCMMQLYDRQFGSHESYQRLHIL
jgi:hypothetical protein